MPDCIPFYEPGGKLTGHTTAAVEGRRFLKVSGNRQSGPGLVPDPLTLGDGSNYRVAHADAGGFAIGVAAWTAAINTKVTVHAVPGMIVPVDAGADITAGAEVEVGVAGRAIPKASGIAVGRAMTAATNGGVAEVRIYGH